jgi:hypothetical protein
MKEKDMTAVNLGYASNSFARPVSVHPVSVHPMSVHPVSVHAATASSHLRLTPRGRAVFTTLAAIPVVIAAFLIAINGGAATASLESTYNASQAASYSYVTINAGESLWAVAQRIAPAADPRDVINDILTFNGMSSAELVPGQRIAIPTAYTD